MHVRQCVRDIGHVRADVCVSVYACETFNKTRLDIFLSKNISLKHKIDEKDKNQKYKLALLSFLWNFFKDNFTTSASKYDPYARI